MSSPPTLDHSAFLYESDHEYVTTLVPHVRTALDRGDGVAVATDPRRAGLLREALGHAAGAVTFLRSDRWYQRPARTIAGWVRLLAASAARGHTFTRLVGEVHFGGPAEHPHWVRYESALNRALGRYAADLLCPYDTRALPAPVTASAGRTHPCLVNQRSRPSPAYVAPERLLRDLREPAIAPPGPPTVELPADATVAGLREELRALAGRGGWLPEHRLEEFVLALSEVATNGVRHGGGLRRLAVWVTADAVVCEVADGGGTPPGPLAGYLPPAPGAVGGMGLWLVRQICDAVHIGAVDGVTRVQFRMDR